MEVAMKPLLDYNGSFVDARGWAGGLGLLWEKNIELNLLLYSLYHMDAQVKLEGESLKWRFTRVYGCAETKRHTGEIIADLWTHFDLPWLIKVDLNEIFYHFEKQGGPSKPRNQIDLFCDHFVENGLFDLGHEGYDFTWSMTNTGGVVIEERLHRFCVSVEWFYFTLKLPWPILTGIYLTICQSY